MALIDAPRLNNLDITLLNDTALEIPQLTRFIGCTSMPEALKKAHVTFQVDGAGVKFSSQTSSHDELKVKIPCRELDEQLSLLHQVFTSPSRVGGPLHLREHISSTSLVRQYREYAMAGTFTPISRCEEFLPMQGNCVMYRACPARARYGH